MTAAILAIAASGLAVMPAAAADATVASPVSPVRAAASESIPDFGLAQTTGRFQFEGRNARRSPTSTFSLDVLPDGSFRIITDDSRCSNAGGSPWLPIYVTAQPCNNSDDQRFYVAPANPTPVSVPNMSRDDQFFYIISVSKQQCLRSYWGDFAPATDVDAQPQMEPCRPGDDDMMWRVANDVPNPAGVNPWWRVMMNLAAGYGTSDCVVRRDGCQVAPTSDPTAFYNISDDGIYNLGVISQANYGCGDPVSGSGKPTFTNDGEVAVSQTMSSTVGVSNSLTLSSESGYAVGGEVNFGLKDVWGAKINGSFNSKSGTVSTSQTTVSRSYSEVLTTPPKKYSMILWSGNQYIISGTWKLGMNSAEMAQGSLAFTIPATSAYPVSVTQDGQVSSVLNERFVVQNHQKSCDAVAQSTQRTGATGAPSTPVAILGANGTCAAPNTPETASPGTTLSVCPGDWNVTGGTMSDAKFEYQWFLVTDLSKASPAERSLIPGATGSSLRIQRATYAADKKFLGVTVMEAGTPGRLQSPEVVATDFVEILPPAVGGDIPEGTNFVGSLPDATRGSAYDESVVGQAGSGISISATGVPDGMNVTPDGELTGNPTVPGTYTITATDNPTDGGPIQTATINVIVHDIATTFADDLDFAATTGDPFTAELVPTVATGMTLEVASGALPAGLTLDPASGVLSGTPTVPGTTTFSLTDALAPSTWASVTITVTDARAAFAAAPLPDASVGTAYAAATVASYGSRSRFGLAESSPALPNGLRVDLFSGDILGTPTTAGTATVQLVDLNDAQTARSVTIRVVDTAAPTATAAPGAKPAQPTLAATGYDPGTLLLVAAGALLLGFAALRRRRTR
ncbi:putative Ig domain-containing protein [Microbacteriaceae bacterium VKM Ac-2855]|nr:putative Ig domain-containing protein [Microbacteriaceae bacterium VKM Ac-2855]